MKVIVDDKIPYIRGQIEQLADEVTYLTGSAISREDVRNAERIAVCADRIQTVWSLYCMSNTIMNSMVV